MSILNLLQLARDNAVLGYEPYYSYLDSPKGDPVEIDEKELEYCLDAKLIRLEHTPIRYGWEVRTNVFKPCTVTKMMLLKEGRIRLFEMESDQGEADEPKQPEEPQQAKMTWQEAAERMEVLHKQGEKFTSQHKLADVFGCSSALINKAIKNTESLQPWAKKDRQPKAQSINPVVTDITPQNREPSPEDDAAIREYIENADPTEKAAFLEMSSEAQLFYLDDPEGHGLDDTVRILGRKP